MILKKLCTFILTSTILWMVITSVASAEEFKDGEYYTFVDEVFVKAVKHQPELYKKLRELYTKTSFYDPNFPPIEVTNGIKAIKEADEKTVTEKIKLYRQIERKYMGDIYTHFSASNYFWSIKVNDMAKRYADVANNIALVAYKSGDGHTPATAFKAINKMEQHFILNYFLKVTSNAKSLQQIDGRLFDVYAAKDVKNGQTRYIYFDITDYFGKGVVSRALKEKMQKNENEAK